MGSPVLLSVVIPSYGEPERLHAALQSLATQDYPPAHVQVIVVDDASPSLDAGPLSTAAGRFAVQVLRNKSNQGRARTRNTGIRAADGQVVVFLDSDMTVAPGFLGAHAALHQASPGAAGIGDVRFGPEIPCSPLGRYLGTRGVHKLKRGAAVPFNCFATGNCSVRREQLVRVGLFDEGFTGYGGEDLELGYRLHRDGAQFHFLPGAIAFHHHLRSLDQLCRLMRTYGLQSMPLLLSMHPELAGLLRVDFLREPSWTLRRVLVRLALAPVLYHPVRMAVGLANRLWVPALLFDYLWWYNRTRGYLAAGSAQRRGTDQAVGSS
jgi:GT2 family glycosyltransferase